MIYKCEGDLGADLAKFLEHVVIKLFNIVDCDVSGNAITTNDALSEKFVNGCGAYNCNRPHLNPFCEILHCYYGTGVVALS
jgi:hypothetical protein